MYIVNVAPKTFFKKTILVPPSRHSYRCHGEKQDLCGPSGDSPEISSGDFSGENPLRMDGAPKITMVYGRYN